MMRIVWVLVVVLLLLTACGRKTPSETMAVEAQPASEDNSANTATPAAESPEAGPLVFVVMREGGGGIDATINQLDAEDKPTLYATVPSDGRKIMTKPCSAGERFRAEPVIEAFQIGAPQPCAPRVEFLLLDTRTTLQFMRRGDAATEAGDFQLAQTNYGIAADRLAYAKPADSRKARVFAAVAAGRVLGVAQPVEGADGKEQPTVEFKDRVRMFQRENGIEQTGELDARTRESIGRMQLRGSDVVVAPAAAAAPVSPQEPAFTKVVDMSVRQMMAAPASPEAAAIIRANRKKMLRATNP
jgi:hypothetical protein